MLQVHIQAKGRELFENLEVVICGMQEAIATIPHDYFDRATRLNSLCMHLSSRYMQLKNLKEAICYVQEAMEISSHSHLNRVSILKSLRTCLYYRMKEIPKELEEVICNLQEVIELKLYY